MCPACLMSVALIAAGTSSTGGLTTLVMRTLRGRSDAENAAMRSQPANEPCSTSEPRPPANGSLPASIT
jgi:hypothetical protein